MYSWYNFSSNTTKASTVRRFLKATGTFLNIPGPETNKQEMPNN